MRYKSVYFYLIWLFCVSSMAGQSSDSSGKRTPYISKRISTGYGIYACPRVLPSGGNPGVNLQHEAFVEFAFAKRVSVGLSARIYRTISENTRQIRERNSLITPDGYFGIKGINYALQFKFLTRKSLDAAWKKYILAGVTLNTFQTSYDPDHMYVTISGSYPINYSYRITDFGPRKRDFRSVDLMFGNGISRTVAGRFVFDFGYSVQVLALLATPFDISDTNIAFPGPNSNDVYTHDYISKAAPARVRNMNRLNLYFKIGYLF